MITAENSFLQIPVTWCGGYLVSLFVELSPVKISVAFLIFHSSMLRTIIWASSGVPFSLMNIYSFLTKFSAFFSVFCGDFYILFAPKPYGGFLDAPVDGMEGLNVFQSIVNHFKFEENLHLLFLGAPLLLLGLIPVSGTRGFRSLAPNHLLLSRCYCHSGPGAQRFHFSSGICSCWIVMINTSSTNTSHDL